MLSKVVFDFNIDYIYVNERSHECKTALSKATDHQLLYYKNGLENRLKSINLDHELITCTENNCNKHCDKMHILYSDIIDSWLQSADVYIPKTGHNKYNNALSHNIAWCSEHVEHLCQESLCWHHHWRDCGQPHNGNVAEMYRITKAEYHRVMKNCDKIRMERIAEAISDNMTRDLFKELSKIKGRNNFTLSNVDGFINEHDIKYVFSTKYKNLYNSVPYNSKRMNDITNEINDKMSDHCNISYRISVVDIFNSVKRLKTVTSGGVESLFSEHIIHGPHLLVVLLTNVINYMLVHSINPECMIIGTMVHITKCKRKMKCCSDNYRAITCSSVVGKV